MEPAGIGCIAAVEARKVLVAAANRLGLQVLESDPSEPEAKWGDGWRGDDVRWTLTPHQLRKLKSPRKR